MSNENDDRKIRREKMQGKMSELKTRLKPYLYGFMTLLIIGAVWYSYEQFFSYAGVTNVITINVYKVEVTERYGEHTIIWGDHALGDRTFRYTLIGEYDLGLGSTYRITYVNRVKILPVSLSIALWGEVLSIEQLQ